MNSDFVCWYLLFPHIGLLRKGIGSRPNQLLSRYFELAKTFKLNLNCYVGMCSFSKAFVTSLEGCLRSRLLDSWIYVFWDWWKLSLLKRNCKVSGQTGDLLLSGLQGWVLVMKIVLPPEIEINFFLNLEGAADMSAQSIQVYFRKKENSWSRFSHLQRVKHLGGCSLMI